MQTISILYQYFSNYGNDVMSFINDLRILCSLDSIYSHIHTPLPAHTHTYIHPCLRTLLVLLHNTLLHPPTHTTVLAQDNTWKLSLVRRPIKGHIPARRKGCRKYMPCRGHMPCRRYMPWRGHMPFRGHRGQGAVSRWHVGDTEDKEQYQDRVINS